MGVKMDLYRSEDMELVQLIIPAESAHDTVTYVGELGLIQFKDLNSDKSPFQRTFAAQVKRCGEMERKLRFFKDQIVKAGLHPAARSVSETDVNLDELEVKLADLESELLEINSNSEKLTRTHSELNELRLVLQQAGAFFTSARSTATAAQRELDSASPASGDEIDSPLLEQEMQTEPSKPVRLGFIAGVVPTDKSLPFERILFRATRGNMFLKLAPIQDSIVDPVTGEKIAKSVFVVFFAGERARTKISKIADVFAANCYPFPDDVPSQRKLLQDVAARLEDLQTTIDASIYHRDSVLTTIGYQLEQWISLVRREKAVFHVLNLLSMDVTKKCLVGEGWCPVASKAKIQDALQRAAFDSNSQVGTIFQVLHTKEEPPTYFITNKFTNSYQEIVDAYGIAKYKEVNPGVFTIISFPFLFAVMFGDWGHGIVLFLASLYLILNEKKYLRSKLSDMVEMTFGGRYVILLMSIFSMYTGLIYNEFFSVPFEIFGKTAYSCTVSEEYCSKEGFQKVGRTYPFGIDPIWHGTRSELPFLNSVKMKMSILLGVAQMTLGIFLSLSNARFFKNYLNIWYEVVPQLLFLGSLFGYLCVLIIIKWVSGSQADLYHVMIYMFLSPLEDPGENQLFWGQRGVQVVLLLIALVAVPWMLLPKPLILRNRHMKKVQNRRYEALRESDTDDIHDNDHNEHDEFEFSEVFVHQMIHTIEFVLGAVSNTASYLRLWALSLAHSQLSSVFYEKVLLTALSYSNPVFWVIGFLVFVMATVGVLLVMETLSAFLHALRLHWVEFQNKFFAGDGYKFQPFSFKTVAEDEI